MSIRSRVEDAIALYELGRFEGALLSALVAAASTARKEEPNKKDRECFEAFLAKSGAAKKIRIEFRGELHPIPHIFYKWLRCELVHEGGIPMDIEFTGEPGSKELSLRAGGAPFYVLQLGHGWFFEILRIVKAAPVNRNEFKKEAKQR